MKCPKCGAHVEQTMLACKCCGDDLKKASLAPVEESETFLTSLIRGIGDHFNPALHAVEEAVLNATQRSKRQR